MKILNNKFKVGQKVKVYYAPEKDPRHEGESPFGIDCNLCEDLNGKIFTITRAGTYVHQDGPEPAYNLEDVKGVGAYEYWWPEWMLRPVVGEVQLELDFGENNDRNERDSIRGLSSVYSELTINDLEEGLIKTFKEIGLGGHGANTWNIAPTWNFLPTGFEDEDAGEEDDI